MMGGGLCWLDYNNDGWLDLFVVNSYTDDQLPDWEAHGGLPRTQLFHNVHGHFVNVTRPLGCGPAVRGEGCVTGDLNGDGRPDIYVTTATNDVLLWNNGNGTFTEGARKAGVVSAGWHCGRRDRGRERRRAARPLRRRLHEHDRPIASSVEGFPANHEGVRDLLFLNEGTSEVPRGRCRGRARQGAVRPQPRCVVRRLQRRRAARPLRRERRGSEPAVPQRAGRPARVPLRRRRARGAGSPIRTLAWESRTPTTTATAARPLRHELAQADACLLREREADAVRRRAHAHSRRCSARSTPVGATRGSISTTTASSTSCSRTARSPSRTSRRTQARSASSRSGRMGASSRPASCRAIASTGAASQPPTTTTTAASTSPSTRSAASSSCSRTRARSAHWLEVKVAPFSPGRS